MGQSRCRSVWSFVIWGRSGVVMFSLQVTAMELLPVACLCLLTCSATTSADENGPAVKVIVKEDSDAILPCSLSTGDNIESKLFDWKKDGRTDVFMYDNNRYGGHHSSQDKQFKGRVSHFPDGLKFGNASIKITKTKVADSGNYTCVFPHLQPGKKYHIKLVVGAAREPYVTILKTEDGVLLQCVVRDASPEPQLQWQDSAGNILPAKEPQVSERGGSYDIILQATVTKTDRYRCVATQEDINHQTHAEIYAVNVPNSGVQSHGSDQMSRKVMIAVAVGVLAELLFL